MRANERESENARGEKNKMAKITFNLETLKQAEVSEVTSFALIRDEISKVGAVVLKDLKTGTFTSDTSSIEGTKEFDIVGQDRIIKTGATHLATLCNEFNPENSRGQKTPYFLNETVQKKWNSNPKHVSAFETAMATLAKRALDKKQANSSETENSETETPETVTQEAIENVSTVKTVQVKKA